MKLSIIVPMWNRPDICTVIIFLVSDTANHFWLLSSQLRYNEVLWIWNVFNDHNLIIHRSQYSLWIYLWNKWQLTIFYLKKTFSVLDISYIQPIYFEISLYSFGTTLKSIICVVTGISLNESARWKPLMFWIGNEFSFYLLSHNSRYCC